MWVSVVARGALTTTIMVAATIGRMGASFGGLPITVSASAVAAGASLEVSGQACPRAVVQVSVSTPLASIASQNVTTDVSGRWMAAIVIPVNAAPGVYDISAICKRTDKATLVYDPVPITIKGASSGGAGIGDTDQLGTQVFLAALLVVGAGLLVVVQRSIRTRRREA